MNIPIAIIRPFEPLGIPFLKLGVEGGIGMTREELDKIKQAIHDFMRTFKHLDLMLGDGKNFIRHGLSQAALMNGADWAKCEIVIFLGRPRAFVEYGKVGGRNQLYSVPIQRPKS
jgi:hypothetical protein